MEHGINTAAIAVAAACVALWGLVSGRLVRWNVTAPIAFVVLGLVTANGPTALFHLGIHTTTARSLVELTLAVVLFADASRVNVRAMRTGFSIPLRLLAIGLPLAIGLGTALAFGLFAGVGIWVAASIGAILAPTDAALGAQIMDDEHVPSGVRRALNVESGLNDGIATPFVNLFLAGALSAETLPAGGVGHAAVDLVGGAGVGVAVGAVGALGLTWSIRRDWSAPGFRPLAVLALAVLAYAASLQAGTNGFVAAFVAGMTFGSVTPPERGLLSFTEEAGELLSLLVWFLFGAMMLVPGVRAAGWADVVFALLALSVARMLPVAVALGGVGLDRATVAFIGWFGPRGLASVVFGLIAVDSLDQAAARTVLGAVVVTVAMSVVAHGASAAPLARRLGRVTARVHPEAPEHTSAPALPTRALRGRRPATPEDPTP